MENWGPPERRKGERRSGKDRRSGTQDRAFSRDVERGDAEDWRVRDRRRGGDRRKRWLANPGPPPSSTEK